MEHVELPGTDKDASRIGLGTWAIGGWMWGGTDEAAALATIRMALDHGVSLIDTAPVYGFGRAEEIVGRALAESGERDRVVLATKLGLSWEGDRIRRDSSPERIRREVQDSLRRLRTDYIDVYQVHWPDRHVPYEKTAETLLALKEEGSIRAIGVCNYSVEQIDAFRRGAPLNTLQPPYNLFERETERELLPYTRANGIVTLTYGALCRGLLSGRMRPDTVFEGDDLRRTDPKFQSPRFAAYLEAVRRLDGLAHQRFGKGVLPLAVRWVLDQGVDVALWGMRRPEQVGPVDDVLGWHLDDESRAEIDAILAEVLGEDSAGAPPQTAHS